MATSTDKVPNTSATGYYRTPGIHWDWVKAAGRPFHYFANGAAVAEVEASSDQGSGSIRILRNS